MSDEVENIDLDLLQRDKRKRQPNFTVREKLELFSIIKDSYAHVLENKATDKTSLGIKEKSWQSIEQDFNSVSSTGIFRDKDCLKRLYENRKREVKKAVAKNRQEQRKTGGGPETKIEIDVADDILLQIMSPKIVKGNLSLFDSDVGLVETPKIEKQNIAEEHYFLKRSGRNILKDTSQPNSIDLLDFDQDGQPNFEVDPSEDLQREGGFKISSDEMCKDSSFTMSSSSSYLQCKLINKENLQSSERPLERPFKMADDLKMRKDSALTPPYLQKNKEVNTSADSIRGGRKRDQERRRMSVPTRRQGIQILASSHVAKKYDQLLDQRKVLLEKQIEIANQDLTFQKRKHQLEIELLMVKVSNEKKNNI